MRIDQVVSTQKQIRNDCCIASAGGDVESTYHQD